jgi:hypothetical protein
MYWDGGGNIYLPTDDELLRLLSAYVGGEIAYSRMSLDWRKAAALERAYDLLVTDKDALLDYIDREYVRRDQARDELLDEQANDARWHALVPFLSTGRERTLSSDDAGNVVSGAPDFEGDDD